MSGMSEAWEKKRSMSHLFAHSLRNLPLNDLFHDRVRGLLQSPVQPCSNFFLQMGLELHHALLLTLMLIV